MSNVIDLFGAYVRTAQAASDPVRRNVDFGEVIVAPRQNAGARGGDGDTGVARPGEPASAPVVLPGIGQANPGPRVTNEPEKKNNGFFGIELTRVFWGTGGFFLFLVGAIMSRPNQVLALSSALDTAGNIVTAPVKGAKGALDTAALFAVAGNRKSKPKELKDGSGNSGGSGGLPAPRAPSPEPTSNGATNVGPAKDVPVFAEVESTKAEARKENAKRAAAASVARRRTISVFKTAAEFVASDWKKPGPVSAVDNAIRQGVPADRVLPGKPDEPRPKVEPPPKDEFKPDPELKKIADEIRASLETPKPKPKPKPKKDDQ